MKLAVFDIDGTLTLGDGLGTRCFFGAFEDAFGASCDRRLESYAESTDGGIALEAALRAIGREPAGHELETFKSLYLSRLEREIGRRERAYRPLPGAGRILEVAGQAGWTVALATGNWRRAAALKLECAGIAPPRIAACSEDGATRREVLAAAVEAAAAVVVAPSFERVVYVGDQPWDLRAAGELGVRFVGVGSRRRILEEHGARAIDDFADAGAFLALLEEA